MNEVVVNRVGWIASFMAVLMFASYIDQIRLNISGEPGSVLLAFATAVNCSSWILYGYLKPQKDWPIISCNVLGVAVSLIAAFTAIIYQ